ncbi:hypothetical protein ACFQ3P_40905 [Paraburkholderia sabiae]|uniref:Uncharacterized protein n=1 Tax=Paraburkholderia sabiae TaxID=273251 RepID=A0ABU9QLW0_9BURK|nr:hypothetical protein [Paraburkholderia sabiae]WJZ77280.1 hypothetical protein QEN71_34975 [Paraburkholderia sabiae]CAD6548205.1 hypothetical protein LMG24235_04544 [Paraburkholderia sabiae]
MNHLATLPPKQRFLAALVCLPLMYLVVKALALGLTWAATRDSILPVVLVGVAGILALVNAQRIAASIVTLFQRQ